MNQTDQINGDMSLSVFMHSADMDWTASPSGAVNRKRFHLVGPAETGQVTSLVRYEPGASFPQHDHPDGEEIYVLSGTFSDQSGDWNEGSHLLNPEGFSHAPFSDEGCLIFVKLRQYSGDDHHTINSREVEVEQLDDFPVRLLNRYEKETTFLMELPGKFESTRSSEGGFEVFVVEGQVTINNEAMEQFDWFRSAPGQSVKFSSNGCVLYVKEGAVVSLNSVSGT